MTTVSSRAICARVLRTLGVRNTRTKQSLSVFFSSLLTALAVTTAFVLGWLETFELKTIDWRIRLQPASAQTRSSRIAVVAITERDLHLLKEGWPLPRTRYAQLIDVLHAQGASAIALNMVLPATPDSEQEDLELARACQRAGSVVLAEYSPQSPSSVDAAFDRSDGSYDVQLLLENAPVVSAAAAAVGHLNVCTDADGTVRRVPVVIDHAAEPRLPLGVAAATLHNNGRAELSNELRRALDRRGRLWIHYRDPRASIDLREDGGLLRQAGIDLRRPIELYSLAEVLGQDFAKENRPFAGKVVLVGCCLSGVASAQLTTPFGRQHGVFVQAALLDTALSGTPLRRMPWEASALMTVLAAIACALLLSRLEGYSTVLWSAVALAAMLGGAMLLFDRYGLIVDVVPPAMAMTFSCVGALLVGLGFARVEVAKRNRELDAILEAGTASAELVGPELTGSCPIDMTTPGAKIIGSVAIPETTPKIVANTVGQAMRAEGCFLFVCDGPGSGMRPEASYGFAGGLDKAECLAAGTVLNRHVLEAGRPVLVSAPRAALPHCPLPRRVRSLLLVPLTIGGETMGTLHLFNKLPLSPDDDNHFSEDDLRMATILGCQGAVSLQNARLYLERHDLFLDFVEAIATSVDLKDRYTHGHSKRVAEHSAGVAAELGFSRAEIKLVALAARLHDVGKIGTPDLLLRKRGRLTQQEFEVIKAHATNAERLFNGKPGWQVLMPGIRHHHERFNSTGYPDGLRGNRIPITARIIAVADAFDAMTSDRPYRTRMHPADACEEIKGCSGTQFDPRIAAAFLQYYRKRFGDQPGTINGPLPQPPATRSLGAAG